MKTWICLLGLPLAAAVLLLPQTGAAHQDASDQIVAGTSIEIAGGVASTWARVNAHGDVIWVGLTIPLAMVENQPEPGDGPAGAIAVLDYPAVVKQTTYFNHAEIHSSDHGHPANPAYTNPARYLAPHFDFHFYGIPVEQVATIPFLPPFPPLPKVSPDRLPAGWSQPEFSVAQMGRHAAPLSEFTAVGPFDSVMIAGFLPDASAMHFIEPMAARSFLLQRKTFTLPVPRPAVLGRATRYPTECVARYDRDADAYDIIFKEFVSVQ